MGDDVYKAGTSAYKNVPQGYKARTFIGTDNKVRNSWGKSRYSVAYYATSGTFTSAAAQVEITATITSTKLLSAYSKVVVTPTSLPSGTIWWIDKNTTTNKVYLKSNATEPLGGSFDIFISNDRIY